MESKYCKPMKKKTLPLTEAYRLIEPGPVVLVSTLHDGRANIMPMTWHLVMEFGPPLVGCVLSAQNHSFSGLKASGECVLNIPTAELAETVVSCGNSNGNCVDKFKTFGLTPVPGTCVKAPLIGECYASLECKVKDCRLISQYNFFILEVVHAWIAVSKKPRKTLHHLGEGEFMVAGRRRSLPSAKTSLGGPSRPPGTVG